MTDTTTPRSTQEVFEDHLRLRKAGAHEDDIARNYADDVAVLSGTGVHRGRDGVRETARILKKHMPGGSWDHRNTLAVGDVAFLEWSGRSQTGSRVTDGADSFVIRNGLIVAQTIHYTVRGDEPGEQADGGHAACRLAVGAGSTSGRYRGR